MVIRGVGVAVASLLVAGSAATNPGLSGVQPLHPWCAHHQRSASLGEARGRVIAARAGTVVVVVFVANPTDPEITTYPKSAKWSRTEAVARAALDSAAGTS